MTVIELKKMLIHRIAEIDDIKFLDAIKTILDSKTQSQTIRLTPEQRFEIMESKKEIERGLYYEQKDIDNKFDSWLSEK